MTYLYDKISDQIKREEKKTKKIIWLLVLYIKMATATNGRIIKQKQ